MQPETNAVTLRRRWSVALLFLVPAALVGLGVVIERSDAFAPLRLAIQLTPGTLPSSVAVPDHEIARGAPILSLYAEDDRLYDPQLGLLTNRRRGGSEWEIPAVASYFDHGRLLYADGVGLRVHDDNDEGEPPEQSFRLYFRRTYGSARLLSGVLFDGASDPVTRLVVHNDRRLDGDGHWWHFVNPLAYDIARQLGAVTPNAQPARVFINGTFHGVYVLTDHVRRPFLESRYGHANFRRADNEMKDVIRALLADVTPLTVESIAQLLDVDSVTRWFISVLICATSDPFATEMFRDQTDPDARWFWVNTDMDHSFMDRYNQVPDSAGGGAAPALWVHDTFATTLDQPTLESEILTRLIMDDPAYRDELGRLVSEILNHRVTAEFLRQRFEHYRAEADRLALEDTDYLERLGLFLAFRPSEVRRLVTQYAGVGSAYRCRVAGADVAFEIDGYPASSGYTGWYFEDDVITVTLADRHDELSHWLVNGQTVRGPQLRHRVTRETEITPVFLEFD